MRIIAHIAVFALTFIAGVIQRILQFQCRRSIVAKHLQADDGNQGAFMHLKLDLLCKGVAQQGIEELSGPLMAKTLSDHQFMADGKLIRCLPLWLSLC